MKSTKTQTHLAESSHSPTRLAAIGMDQRQRSALRMLFSSRCNKRYILTEEASSEICILDLDSFGGEQKWKEFRDRHPQWPLILVSINDHQVSDRNTLFVQKPIPVERLIAAIETHRNNLSGANDLDHQSAVDDAPGVAAKSSPRQDSFAKKAVSTRRAASLMSASQEQAFVGTSPDIDPENPDQVEKIVYNPEHYLQGLCQQALNQAVRYNRAVGIAGPWPQITLDIERNRVWLAGTEKQLRPFCTLPDATLEVELIPQAEEWSPSADAKVYPLQAFIWQLALWASRGRLPQGTKIHQPIYIRRWPNFTRLVITPYAMAIAALWAQQPRSLLDTASALNIPQRYVFAFYSAAHAIQLAGETRRAVDTLIQPPAVEGSTNRGLFGRLLDRLRGGKGKDE
ncbi:MAG: hypothetical protein ABW096_10100 [Candidatus Thiodiazotropha sp.]